MRDWWRRAGSARTGGARRASAAALACGRFRRLGQLLADGRVVWSVQVDRTVR
jgi:hypothetical protein